MVAGAAAGSGSFGALRHRNYRLLWGGQLVSTAGSMMQNAAVLWHVALLAPPAEKALALGLVGLAKFVPIVVFSLASGVVADALDRRRLMLVTTSIMALLAAVLAAATFAGLEALWPVYLLTGLSSAVGTFDGPARQSLIPQIVPARDLASALGLIAILFEAASVAGPALAGLMIAGWGLGGVYCANALSFLAVIAALLAMRDVPARPPGARPPVSVAAALEGLRFVFREPLIRSSMLLDFWATLFSSAMSLLPIFAQDLLGGDERSYGLLYAAPAVGALAASAWLALYTPRIVRRGAWLIGAITLYGLATVAFGLSTSFWTTYACLALVGATDMVSTVLRNIIRQFATPDHLRGRMTSVNMIFFMGGPQLGELEAGAVAQAFGARFSVVSGGIGCLLVTAWIAARTPGLRGYRRERPIAAVSEAVGT